MRYYASFFCDGFRYKSPRLYFVQARKLQEEEDAKREKEDAVRRRELDIKGGKKKSTYDCSSKEDKNKKKEKKFRGKEVFESSISYATLEEKRREKAKQQKGAKPKTGAGMSFNDLMKMAKTNATSSKLADDGTLVKRKEKKVVEQNDKRDREREKGGKAGKSNDRPSSSKSSKRSPCTSDDDDDERYKQKMKQKHEHINNKKSSKLKNSRREPSDSPPPSKHKQSRREPSYSPPPAKRKHVREPSDSPPPKRGLIAQTIATKKNGNIQPSGKQKKKLSGIEAQFARSGGFGSSQKKSQQKPKKRMDDDMDDELDREMRMLAKKRKAFERGGGRSGGGEDEEEFYDSEEDYDLDEESEEDDGFIDDTEAAPNVGKIIRKITGYDRRIYSDEEDDCANMESNFSQIQKEEARRWECLFVLVLCVDCRTWKFLEFSWNIITAPRKSHLR